MLRKCTKNALSTLLVRFIYAVPTLYQRITDEVRGLILYLLTRFVLFNRNRPSRRKTESLLRLTVWLSVAMSCDPVQSAIELIN